MTALRPGAMSLTCRRSAETEVKMTYSHEIINYPLDLPMTLFMNTIGTVQKHWHKSIELLIVIEGTVDMVIGSNHVTLGVDDVFLVNSNEIHDLHSDNATMITIQIKPDLLSNVPAEFKNTHYCCDSTRDADPAKYEPIKHIVSRFLKLNLDGGKYIELMNESLFYNLIYELYANFADGVLSNEEDTFKQLDRLNEILAIINSEYTSRLSLEDIAERVYVTPPYLSKFFKKNMGISLSDYIKATRLRYAVHDLMYCDFPIETIAQNNGFPNTHAFVSAFKEKYDMLPSIWRTTQSKTGASVLPADKDRSFNYYETDQVSMHRALLKFINAHLSSASFVTPVVQTSETTLTVSGHNAVEMPDCVRFIGVSRAKELLYEPVRRQLREANSQIRFDYIKMHSLFEDGLFVYTEASDGRPVYNFTLLDQIFDFLLSIKLKPLIQLSFMPSTLAQDTSRRLFNGNLVISEPKDMERWKELIRHFVLHLIERYTLDTVKTWLFCVWNEPGTASKLFGFRKDEIYYELYRATCSVVKSISAELLFGGPAAFLAYGKKDTWLINFLKFAAENQCRPDFITFHYYDIDLSDAFFLKRKTENELWLSTNERSTRTHLEKLKVQLQKLGFDNVPLYLTEWNSTTSHRDLLSDTCFKSAYLVKNIIDIAPLVDGICYWLLTDFHEEHFLPKETFHGGLGLYTYNGIKKPSCHALLFLIRLGRRILYKDDGLIVTERNGDTVILLYNYHHYSETYAHDIGINTLYTERYSVFPDKDRKKITLCLPELTGVYTVTHEYVNRSHGSAFDSFIKMGALEPLSGEDLAFLGSQSIPEVKKQLLSSPDLTISLTLQPFEIRLITLRKKLT